MTVDEDLDASQHAKSIIEVQTTHPEDVEFRGIVLTHNPSLVVIYQVRSFEEDGLVVVPKRWIRGVRNSDYEQCATDVFKVSWPSGIVGVADWWLCALSLEEVVGQLKKADAWPAVEVVYNGEASLYAGPIIALNQDGFTMRCYDAAARWEGEFELEYSEVFKIESDSRYLRHFNAYMRARSPSRAGA